MADGPRIGTAGWAIPREETGEFPGEGTQLARYAARFSATEINSSFHRPHRRSTYERWAATVPPTFRFSVKLPRAITHTSRLTAVEAPVAAFLAGALALGEKLGCLLVQLPPSLVFDAAVADGFFTHLREHFAGHVACEPRHVSWLLPEADAMLKDHRVARVAADPDRPVGAREPGGWPDLHYYRLHGSPRMYYSSYAMDDLDRLAARVATASGAGKAVWCIFDNTTHGAAARNARELVRLSSLRAEGGSP